MGSKIVTIAKIVFALIFVVGLAVMMGTITSKTNSANTKLVDTLEMTDGMELNSYDGTSIKGSAVVNAISNGKSLGGNMKLFFYVETGEGEEIYGYGEPTGSGEALSGMTCGDGTSFDKTVYSSNTYKNYSNQDSGDEDYINQSAEFNSEVITNKNGVTVGIYFHQQS